MQKPERNVWMVLLLVEKDRVFIDMIFIEKVESCCCRFYEFFSKLIEIPWFCVKLFFCLICIALIHGGSQVQAQTEQQTKQQTEQVGNLYWSKDLECYIEDFVFNIDTDTIYEQWKYEWLFTSNCERATFYARIYDVNHNLLDIKTEIISGYTVSFYSSFSSEDVYVKFHTNKW